MRILRTRKLHQVHQYIISLGIIILTSGICYLSVDLIGYRVIALVLLFAVSINAILFDFFPVILSAFLSALLWNYFFIPPLLTFRIKTAEDALVFLMYFVIASINALLTHRIRISEQIERDEKEKEKAIRLYNTLLNSLSHELRTPISTIIGAIDTIKEKSERLSDTHRAILYQEIERASLRLNRQVENLLNMGRLEAGFIQPKNDWCDINELIFSAIQENQEDAANRSILFEPSYTLPLFKLDAGLLGQILHNIIHNALQYTPPSSTISIQAKYIDNQCIISISDNGKGFPEEEISHVFDKFHRLNNTKTGGTGLGLSIVKGFTEAMNGKVELTNQPTGGALFMLTFPAESTFINQLKNE